MTRITCFAVMIAVSGRLLAADPVDYLRDIKPILAEKCFACHGAINQESGLRLDTAALAIEGGESGAAIVPSSSADSLIVAKVTGANDESRMPPEDEGQPLSSKQVELLRAWIDQGAAAPDEPIPLDPRDHWAYQVPLRPPIPPRTGVGESYNAIDRFIAAKRDAEGFIAVGSADPLVLLRRVYLDLIGLPPMPRELRAFEAAVAAEGLDSAYEQVVNRLLASPQYGERWGRQWMDVWRYSDWSGFKNAVRESQRHIWRWRDWIVESLNADKGYDRMILEMLAGDELAPGDPNVLRAGGYLVRNFHHSNRNVWLDATVEHTAKAFLAMTINCARCHDHKFDPIPQTAFYQMRAIFEPHRVRTDRVPGVSNLMKDGLPRVYDAELDTETYVFARGNEKQPDKEHPVAPAVPAVLGGHFEIQPVKLPLLAYYPALQPHVEAESLAAGEAAVKGALRAVAATKQKSAQAADSDAAKNKAPVRLATLKLAAARASQVALSARWEAERAKYAPSSGDDVEQLAAAAVHAQRDHAVRQARAERFEKRQALATATRNAAAGGDDDAKAKQALTKAEEELAAAKKTLAAAKAALNKPGGKYQPVGTEYPQTSSGRRLALARWIVSQENPLTARVAVNHVWLRHFGAPLVEQVFDFGLRSPPPLQQPLLDWLAVEFAESGWSMKHLHRLMVTSATYRLASGPGPTSAAAAKRDPDNRYWWRANLRRLDAEAIRDSVLYVAGQLDLTRGGPDIDCKLGESVPRRSIYFRHAYEKQMRFLQIFDEASVNECYRRSESIIPQQALALSNSSLSLAQARRLAARLSGRAPPADGHEAEFIKLAFEYVLSRRPSAKETDACRQFLVEQAARLDDSSQLSAFAGGPDPLVQPSKLPAQRAREGLVHVLLNHNDFVTIR